MARAHGIEGEVAVEVLTSVPDSRFSAGAVLVEVDGERTFTVRTVRPHRGRLLVRFEEVFDRTQAEALNGVLLAGAGDATPPEGEVWAADLEGYAVLDAGGATVGTVREVMANPAHDLLVVGRDGRPDALVPLVAPFVVEWDDDARRIVIDPPEGLL